MAKLLITTQYSENYGSVKEPYWKMKGGYDYAVLNIGFEKDYEWAAEYTDRIITAVRDQVEINNGMCEEHILGWEIVADDYLTEYERSQLEYDGHIQFPTRILTIEENANV